MKKIIYIIAGLLFGAVVEAEVVVSHPGSVPENAAFSVEATGGTPLATHYYTANDEWDGLSMTWQWPGDEELDGLGFHIKDVAGITTDQDYLLVIQEMTGSYNATIASNVAVISFTLTASDMTAGWVYLDIDDVPLSSNQWYGVTLGPATDAGNVVAGQEISWATASWGASAGFAASIDLSGGMPRTAKYESTSADVSIYGVAKPELADVDVSHPGTLPGNAEFSVAGLNGTPLATHYTASDEWDGFSMTWQWTSGRKLDGLGFYIAGVSGITSDQDYLLVIQEMTGSWHETVVSNVAVLNFTLPASDMTEGWIYFDIEDLNLISNQWYGVTLGPSTSADSIVPGQEISWATGSYGGSAGIAASIDLSGGMPITYKYSSTSADVALYGLGVVEPGDEVINLSITVDGESVIVSALGFLTDRTYVLKSQQSVGSASWNAVGTPTTGVYETNWTFPATNAAAFYRVESE